MHSDPSANEGRDTSFFLHRPRTQRRHSGGFVARVRRQATDLALDVRLVIGFLRLIKIEGKTVGPTALSKQQPAIIVPRDSRQPSRFGQLPLPSGMAIEQRARNVFREVVEKSNNTVDVRATIKRAHRDIQALDHRYGRETVDLLFGGNVAQALAIPTGVLPEQAHLDLSHAIRVFAERDRVTSWRLDNETWHLTLDSTSASALAAARRFMPASFKALGQAPNKSDARADINALRLEEKQGELLVSATRAIASLDRDNPVSIGLLVDPDPVGHSIVPPGIEF